MCNLVEHIQIPFVVDRKEVEQRRMVMVCGLQAEVLLMTFSSEVLTLSAVSFWF